LASQRRLISAAVLILATVLGAHRPALAQETADALFAQAKADAKAQHKNVLMVFSASWCGPCQLYERFLEDPRMMAITDREFVIQRIDVGERKGDPRHSDTPGGAELRSSLGAVGEPGFPFLVMTDENGDPIVNSYRNGDTSANIGYPASPAEIDWYIEMLKRAALSLSPGELAATNSWLQKHSRH